MNDSDKPVRRTTGGASGASSERTRTALLDAARRVVRDHGLAGATSRQITAEAGANLAAITYHFGSKDELVAEALFDEIRRRVTPVLDALEAPGDPAQRMLGAVQELLAEFERSRRDTVVYLEALLLATRDARYRRSALRIYRTISTRLTTTVAELQQQGTVPAWVDPPAMASLILAVANGIAFQTRLDPRGPDQVAMAGQFASLLLSVQSPGTTPG
jgi:AcrR family transcriptional regulator